LLFSSPSHLPNFPPSRIPSGASAPTGRRPHSQFHLPYLPSSFYSDFRIPTSAFPISPHLNQIWFKNHIWCFLCSFFQSSTRASI
jgi:hypothetical protein